MDLYCWSLAAPSDMGMYFGAFREGVMFVVEMWLEGKYGRVSERKGGGALNSRPDEHENLPSELVLNHNLLLLNIKNRGVGSAFSFW
jgi:hypothetical protein